MELECNQQSRDEHPMSSSSAAACTKKRGADSDTGRNHQIRNTRMQIKEEKKLSKRNREIARSLHGDSETLEFFPSRGRTIIKSSTSDIHHISLTGSTVRRACSASCNIYVKVIQAQSQMINSLHYDTSLFLLDDDQKCGLTFTYFDSRLLSDEHSFYLFL